MNKFHIVVDLEKCVGCHSCIMACKDEFCGNSWLPYTDEQQLQEEKWIRVQRVERSSYPRAQVHYLTRLCNHCDNAACVKAYPDVFFKREDGLVLMDPVKAKGRPEIAKACPYGCIDYNNEIGAAQKCTGCAHLLDSGWKEPRCVQVCPLRALKVVSCEDGDFEKLSKAKGLEPLTAESAKSRVLYKNLHLYNKVYIAGAVAKTVKGTEECANGEKVALYKNDALIAETVTDTYGDFYFDKLDKNSGVYMVKCGSVSAQVTVGDGCADTGCLLLK